MDNNSLAIEIWNNFLNILKKEIKEQAFLTWFKPIVPLSVEDQQLVIQVPSEFFSEWIENHYKCLINKTIKSIMGEDAKICFRVRIADFDPDARFNPVKYEPQSVERKTSEKNIFSKEEIFAASNLNSKYTFNNFVVGENNQLATAAAMTIAANPCNNHFNPLIIYGCSGHGKSHLIQAVGNEVIKNNNDKLVNYISSDKFTDDYFEFITDSNANEFSNYYKSMDILIVGDIRVFSGKETAKEIFSHIFNAQRNRNKQIIIGCDKSPRELNRLTEYIVSRLNAGLIIEIRPHEYDTRIKILKNKCEFMNIYMSDEIIEFIAAHSTSNIRELEITLIEILTESSIQNRKIDIDLVRFVISKRINNMNRLYDQNQILNYDYYGI